MFQPSGKTLDGRVGNILDLAHVAGVEIDAPCGGRETCGKCRIVVRHGTECVSPVKDSEKRFLSDAEISAGYRLSCCALALKGDRVVLEVPPESQLGFQRLLVRGLEPDVSLSPVPRKFLLDLPEPKLGDLRADTERFFDVARERTGLKLDSMAYDALKALPRVLREGEWKVTLTARDGEVIAVEPGDTKARLYGFAIDIGTTKIAGYLVDLNTGRNIATFTGRRCQKKHLSI